MRDLQFLLTVHVDGYITQMHQLMENILDALEYRRSTAGISPDAKDGDPEEGVVTGFTVRRYARME